MKKQLMHLVSAMFLSLLLVIIVIVGYVGSTAITTYLVGRWKGREFVIQNPSLSCYQFDIPYRDPMEWYLFNLGLHHEFRSRGWTVLNAEGQVVDDIPVFSPTEVLGYCNIE